MLPVLARTIARTYIHEHKRDELPVLSYQMSSVRGAGTAALAAAVSLKHSIGKAAGDGSRRQGGPFVLRLAHVNAIDAFRVQGTRPATLLNHAERHSRAAIQTRRKDS